ncbi:uncharacterized protein LOC134274823 [Saccostrea cucullata]|uniref:uncharacterized protein LOC134274823 n=1 Tax=Saccostrea cuccullata TaxID=36930 RepID=UPI002ED00617
MNMKLNTQCLCILILISLHISQCLDTLMIVKKLFEKVRSSQIQKTTKSLPPFSWHKEKGLFESHVKLYFHGSFSEFMLREGFEIFDNNNFATAWITTALLEVHQLENNGTYIDEELILNAVKAMGNFVDKNNKFNTSVQTFWPQTFNETVATWQSTPQNLLQLFALFDDIPWSVILNFIQKLHLADAEMIKNIKQLLQENTFPQILYKINHELQYARKDLEEALKHAGGDILAARKRVMWLEDRMGTLCGKVRLRGQPVSQRVSHRTRGSTDRGQLTLTFRSDSDVSDEEDRFPRQKSLPPIRQTQDVDSDEEDNRGRGMAGGRGRMVETPSISGSEDFQDMQIRRPGMMYTPSSEASSSISPVKMGMMQHRGPRYDSDDSDDEDSSPQPSPIPKKGPVTAEEKRESSEGGSEAEDHIGELPTMFSRGNREISAPLRHSSPEMVSLPKPVVEEQPMVKEDQQPQEESEEKVEITGKRGGRGEGMEEKAGEEAPKEETSEETVPGEGTENAPQEKTFITEVSVATNKSRVTIVSPKREDTRQVSQIAISCKEFYGSPKRHTIMKRVQEILREALCGKMTTSILMSYKTDSDGSVFYDDFLGDGDRSLFINKTIKRGEDRIFTTSMAINALLTTWTSYDIARKRLTWVKGVPTKVVDVVKRAVQWMCRNVLSRKYRPWNAFFSGSVKSFNSMPWWYPSNRKEYLNGTSIADDTHIPSDATIIAMQGVKSPEWYNTQLNRKHFGFNVPMVFHGYNAEKGPFPFWSSEPYTYVSAMLSLVKYKNVMTEP